MRWQTTLVFAHVLAFIACASASNSGAPAPQAPAKLDQRFTLKVGATMTIDGEGIQVGFESVVSDSRCPKGVQCIRAGEAEIRIWLSQARGRELRELKTSPPAAAQAVIDRYRITLVSLEPEPTVERELRPSDYVATLVVNRLP